MAGTAPGDVIVAHTVLEERGGLGMKLLLEAGEALYRRVGAGGRRSIRFAGDRWEESGDEFARIIATVTRGIEEGLFFAGADDRMCERCDFAIACTAGGRRLFERKARRDQRSRNYLEMRGMDEEEK